MTWKCRASPTFAPVFVTVGYVHRFTGIPVDTLRALFEANEIEGAEITKGGHRRIPRFWLLRQLSDDFDPTPFMRSDEERNDEDRRRLALRRARNTRSNARRQEKRAALRAARERERAEIAAEPAWTAAVAESSAPVVTRRRR